MSLVLNNSHLEQIKKHATSTYPEECCGFLIGRAAEGREIVEVKPAPNALDTSRHNRYLVDPRDLLKTEREASGRGLLVLGFYHSHPDAPAKPSEYDLLHAWPWYHYLILSVIAGEPADLMCWTLDEEQKAFNEVETSFL